MIIYAMNTTMLILKMANVIFRKHRLVSASIRFFVRARGNMKELINDHSTVSK